MDIFKNSGEYKHFKGGEYKVVCNVFMDDVEMVLYKSVKSDSYWLRKVDVFFETLAGENGEKPYPRFAMTNEFDDVFCGLLYMEFNRRIKGGEKIIFEEDMSLCVLTEDSTLENPKVVFENCKNE